MFPSTFGFPYFDPQSVNEKMIDIIIKELDNDGDGKLTFDEIKSVIR